MISFSLFQLKMQARNTFGILSLIHIIFAACDTYYTKYRSRLTRLSHLTSNYPSLNRPQCDFDDRHDNKSLSGVAGMSLQT